MPVVFTWWWQGDWAGWGAGPGVCIHILVFKEQLETYGVITLHYHNGQKMFVAFNEMGC